MKLKKKKITGSKFGKVLLVKFDKKKPTSAWVTFADKKSARVASKKVYVC